MPATTATASGKIILFGEHAVVYGQPAIAVPVKQVCARAVVSAAPRAPVGQVSIQAPDIYLDTTLDRLPDTHPLVVTIRGLQTALGLQRLPACNLRVTSTIPLAAGLGSGAAISVAILRALSTFLGYPLEAEQLSNLTYEVEKIYHGTPSGIDNTVVSYEAPVYFVRDRSIEPIYVATPFTIVIGDSGVASSTAVAVGDVRRAWQADPDRFESLFAGAGEIASKAKALIETGDPDALGVLMDKNHALLQQMDVSSPELERLVTAARLAGALGAKLSGGGRGGNVIALARPGAAAKISDALLAHGAARTIVTQIDSSGLSDLGERTVDHL
ncbi:mevalonate kinase [Chloroflexota bacterium]